MQKGQQNGVGGAFPKTGRNNLRTNRDPSRVTRLHPPEQSHASQPGAGKHGPRRSPIPNEGFDQSANNESRETPSVSFGDQEFFTPLVILSVTLPHGSDGSAGAPNPETATGEVNNSQLNVNQGLVSFQAETRSAFQAIDNRNSALKRRTEILNTRTIEVDGLCQSLIRWNTRITDEVNTRGTVIEQNSKDIKYLSQRCASLTEAQNSAWEDTQIIHQRLHVHNERFADVTGGQRTLENKLDTQRAELIQMMENKIRTLGHGTADQATPPVKLDLPTYSGAPFEQPVRFIKNLNNYINAIGASDHSALYLVEAALRGPASDWYEHVRDRIANLEDFRTRFLQRFWNSATQAKIKRELELGVYRASNNLSQSEYVLRLYNMVRALTHPPAEEAAVECFSRHFDETAQMAIVSQSIRTIDALVTLLDTIDQASSLNTANSQARRVDFHSRERNASTGTSDPSRGRSDSFRSSTPRLLDGKVDGSSNSGNLNRGSRPFQSRDSSTPQPSNNRGVNEIVLDPVSENESESEAEN